MTSKPTPLNLPNDFYLGLDSSERPKFLRLTAATNDLEWAKPLRIHSALPIVAWDSDGDPRVADPRAPRDTVFLRNEEWLPVNEDGTPWSPPTASSNAQVSTEPVGKGDARLDKETLVNLFADFLLNTIPQSDDVSIALVARFARRQVENALVFARKQHDYGPGNIAASGENGIFVRLCDKIARIDNLRGREAKNEGIGDSWLDIAVYAPMAQMVREGEWPGCKARDLLAPRPKTEG